MATEKSVEKYVMVVPEAVYRAWLRYTEAMDDEIEGSPTARPDLAWEEFCDMAGEWANEVLSGRSPGMRWSDQ